MNESTNEHIFPVGERGEIRDLLFLGYMPIPGTQEMTAMDCVDGFNFELDLLEKHGGEANIIPEGGASVELDSGTYEWKHLHSDSLVIPMFNDGNEAFLEKHACHLFCEIISPKDQKGWILAGTDDSARIILNGETVHEFIGWRGANPDTDWAPIELKEGANPLMIRLDNYLFSGGIALRLIDESGQPLNSLKIRLKMPENTKKQPFSSYDWAEIQEFIAPLPPAPNEALFGARLTKTMSLLNSGHITGRPLKIMFYGQSITCQEWTIMLIKRLQDRYPDTRIIVENRALGGFDSPRLIKTAIYDLTFFNPDLVIFHDYGELPFLEEIFKILRRHSTAEALIYDSHLALKQKDDSLEALEQAEYSPYRFICQAYNCEHVDVKEEWKAYLRAHPTLGVPDLLKDAVHLNFRGCALMASLVERHFKTNTLAQSNWGANLRRYQIHEYFERKKSQVLAFTGDDWSYDRETHFATTGNPENSVTLTFTGTQVDVILASDSGPAEVEIDDKKPSELGLLFPTRFNTMSHWCTPQRVYWGDKLIPEIWTLTYTEMELVEGETDAVAYKYEVEGSVTGPDGIGDHKSVFKSDSGSLIIDPADMRLWHTPHSSQFLKPGLQVHWIVENAGKDQITPGDTRFVTAARGLSWESHKITLRPILGAAPLKIEGFEVHRPMLVDD